MSSPQCPLAARPSALESRPIVSSHPNIVLQSCILIGALNLISLWVFRFFCISTLDLPHSAMNCGLYREQAFRLESLLRTESYQEAGIAVFPMPTRSPAMSSLPLAVERAGPVFHAHTDPWLALSTTVQPYCAATAERPVSTTPSVPNPQSPSICVTQIQNTNTNTNKHSASTGISQSHIQHERGVPRQSLRRHSEPFFHSLLSSGHFHFTRVLCPASARVISVEQLWLSPGLLAISKHS